MKKDLVIIGAGPAGLSFARSLADTKLKIAVIEKLSKNALAEPAIDGRDIALTHLSRKILTELGAWSRIPEESISLIKEAKVLDGNSPYALHFDYRKVCDDALGYLISNHLIRKALYEEVEPITNIDLITDVAVTKVSSDHKGRVVTLSNKKTIEAPLVVAADSRFSETRRKVGISAAMQDFGRVVIVCRMRHEKSHKGVAHECFHYGRTLAVLPLAEKLSSIVITVPTYKSDEILNMSEDRFNRDIEHQFQNRLGKMELVGKRYPYPLVAVHADRFATNRFALIGDAAVGMHPVTAHGFNLGLRGQDTLARLIKLALARGQDIGSSIILERYQSKHRRVSKPLYLGTNAIVKLYTNDLPLHKIMRKAVLRFGNNFPPIKRIIIDKLTEIRN